MHPFLASNGFLVTFPLTLVKVAPFTDRSTNHRAQKLPSAAYAWLCVSLRVHGHAMHLQPNPEACMEPCIRGRRTIANLLSRPSVDCMTSFVFIWISMARKDSASQAVTV